MDAITKVALQKFNQGKNASCFKAELEPGIYNIQFTATLLGVLRKGKPGRCRRRDDSGSAHIVRYLLDRLSYQEYHALVADLTNIRAGRFQHKDNAMFDARLDIVMPYIERPRSGSTRFDGELILEDVDTNTPAIP
mgnify:CR=1 FL=1